MFDSCNEENIVPYDMPWACLLYTSQTPSNEKDENKPRTTYTTEQLPDETYRNPETLHILFEKMSGLQLDNEVQEKKLTVYNLSLIHIFYNADNPKEYQFSGSRIHRGLYKTCLLYTSRCV